MGLTGCFLDTGTLPGALDWSELTASLDQWRWHHNIAPDTVAETLTNVDVVVTNKVVLNAERLATAKQLKLICVAATGVNNIDLTAAREYGIDVVNVTDYATESVCQQVFAFILDRATRVAEYDRLVKNGGWTESEFFFRFDYPIEQMAGQTLVIVGGGNTGNAVARASRAFGMHVLIAERPGTNSIRDGRTPFLDALAKADVLSLHCPLTETTRGLIDANALENMKSTAMLVNTARGGIVDSVALAHALRKGTIASAAVDVLDAEPPSAEHPLLANDIPNLRITPHNGWASQTARQRIIDQLAIQIVAFAEGREITPVN